MNFTQSMFVANYVIFALAEKPSAIFGSFVLMLVWGVLYVIDERDRQRHAT